MTVSTLLRLAGAGLLLLCAACGFMPFLTGEPHVSPEALDERIVAEISTRFLKAEDVTYLDIQPRSYAGHVYLIGEASSPGELDAAVDISKDVQGVRSVTTYVLPKPEQPACSSLDNARIESRVRTALSETHAALASRIDLTVFQCRVVLTGTVPSREDEAALLAEIQAVEGVGSARSLLRVAKRK